VAFDPFALVQIELGPQVFLRADVVAVVRVGSEEFVVALHAGSHSWDFILVLQDDEAALRHVPRDDVPLDRIVRHGAELYAWNA